MYRTLSNQGIEITDQIIEAMATRPIDRTTTLEEPIKEFRAG